MKRFAVLLATLAVATGAYAQQQSSLAFPPTTILAPANNQCLVYQSSSKTWVNGSCASGGGATITGSPVNGNLAFFSGAGTISNGDLSGDCLTSGTGVLTCTKTGGVAFAAVATSGSASDITSGQLPSLAQLPPIASGTLLGNSSGCPGNTSGQTVAPCGLTGAPSLDYYPTNYGAKCDGVTDDTAAFNALSTLISASTQGAGNIVQPPNKSCLINSANVLLKPGVRLVGAGFPMTGNGIGTSVFVPFIILNPAYSLVCGSSASIENMTIMRSGLANRPTTMEQIYSYITSTIADSSTAIQFTGYDCAARRLQIIGFNTAISSSHAARTLLEEIYCDDANCVEINHNADVSFVNIVRGYPFWSTALGQLIGTYNASISAGGSGYVNGDLLTVPGGTCTTQPTLTATASGGVISALAITDSGNCTVSPQTWGVTGGSVYAGGSGGTTGAQTVTVTAPNCTTAPQYSVTVSGGAITAVNSVATAGVCALLSLPNPQAAVTGAGLSGAVITMTTAKNLLSLTGGAGSGATASIKTFGSSYRPGTCLNIHDQADGIKVDGLECQEYQTALSVSNIWNGRFHSVGGEGGYLNADKQTTGILTQNCVADTIIEDPESDNYYVGLELDHRSSALGGSCAGASNSSASLTILGGHLGYNNWITNAAVHTGANSTGLFDGSILGWVGSGFPVAFQIGATSGAWEVEKMQFDGSSPSQWTQWVSVDPTATAPISQQFVTSATGSVLLNGDFTIDQFNEGASNSSTIRADRWRTNNSYNANIPSQRISTSAPTGYVYSLKFTIGSAVSPTTSGDSANLRQRIEAPAFMGLGWGSTSAQPMQIEWCANASVTGTYTIAIMDNGQDTSYDIPFVIGTANSWTCFSRVVPGPSIGTWTTAPGVTNAYVFLDLGAGSTLQTANANVWQGAKYFEITGAVQPSTQANMTLSLAAVHLRRGPFAPTTYIPREYGAELALVQRYFTKSFSAGTAVGQNKGTPGAVTLYTPFTSGSAGAQIAFPVPMVVAPTLTLYSTSATTANCYDSTKAADVAAGSAVNIGTSGFFLACSLASGSPAAGDQIQAHWAADSGQ